MLISNENKKYIKKNLYQIGKKVVLQTWIFFSGWRPIKRWFYDQNQLFPKMIVLNLVKNQILCIKCPKIQRLWDPASSVKMYNIESRNIHLLIRKFLEWVKLFLRSKNFTENSIMSDSKRSQLTDLIYIFLLKPFILLWQKSKWQKISICK